MKRCVGCEDDSAGITGRLPDTAKLRLVPPPMCAHRFEGAPATPIEARTSDMSCMLASPNICTSLTNHHNATQPVRTGVALPPRALGLAREYTERQPLPNVDTPSRAQGSLVLG